MPKCFFGHDLGSDPCCIDCQTQKIIRFCEAERLPLPLDLKITEPKKADWNDWRYDIA